MTAHFKYNIVFLSRLVSLSLTILVVVLLQSTYDGGRVYAKLPIAKIGQNIIKLEVASTKEEIQRGLMYRTSLPENAGMVFLFHPPRPVNFWMYHTLIPLDMLFIKDGVIIQIFENVPPCRSEKSCDCPIYPAGYGITVSEVIEVNGGYTKRHNIHIGDRVKYEMP